MPAWRPSSVAKLKRRAILLACTRTRTGGLITLPLACLIIGAAGWLNTIASARIAVHMTRGNIPPAVAFQEFPVALT